MICSPQEKNIAGQKFGKLTAIRRDFDEKHHPHTFWLFKCDCGNTSIIRKNSVMSGKQTTCGCSRDEGDITGKKYNRWTAIKRDHSINGNDPYWIFKCDCGNTRSVRKYTVVKGVSKSCGCFREEHGRKMLTKHGMFCHELYQTWVAMNKRCYLKNYSQYKNYGARGIAVCDRWRNSFEDFLEDVGERPKGMTLDRIDNDGDYSPENCRWATVLQQANNKRNNVSVVINGVKYSTISEASRRTGLSIRSIKRHYI